MSQTKAFPHQGTFSHTGKEYTQTTIGKPECGGWQNTSILIALCQTLTSASLPITPSSCKGLTVLCAFIYQYKSLQLKDWSSQPRSWSHPAPLCTGALLTPRSLSRGWNPTAPAGKEPGPGCLHGAALLTSSCPLPMAGGKQMCTETP